MKHLFLLTVMLVLWTSVARSEDDGPPATALAMVPEDHRLVPMFIHEHPSWTIFIVTDRRLIKGSPFAGPTMFLKLLPSDETYLEIDCLLSGKPVCQFSQAGETGARAMSIEGTLLVIRGDGCIFSAVDWKKPNSPRRLYCRKSEKDELKLVPMTGEWP